MYLWWRNGRYRVAATIAACRQHYSGEYLCKLAGGIAGVGSHAWLVAGENLAGGGGKRRVNRKCVA